MNTATEPVFVREGALRRTEAGWVLVGSRCEADGHISFPPRDTCPECLGQKSQPVELAATGTLFAHTTVHMRTAHFNPPYQVGYVDLDQGGPRVFAPLQGAALDIGQRMRLIVEPMWEENEHPVIAYRFAAIGEESHA